MYGLDEILKLTKAMYGFWLSDEKEQGEASFLTSQTPPKIGG